MNKLPKIQLLVIRRWSLATKDQRPGTKDHSGFTLIELMVAIAIVAIMATVGLVIFNNTTMQARDSRRKQDIDAIANALESKKTSGTYQYGSWVVDSDFAGTAGIPSDPKGRIYCITTDGTVPPDPTKLSAPPAAWTGTTCPTGYSTADKNLIGALAGTWGTVTSWRVCASLEQNSQVYCKSNNQ